MKIKKGAKYKRVSTRHQYLDDRKERVEDGSLEMQDSRINRCLEYKSACAGVEYKIIEDIEDAGKSAKNTKRPGFQRLWRLVKNKEVDFVVATDISRLSRSTVDFLNFVQHCKDNDVELILLNPEVDTSTPSGSLVLTVLASLAQFEREQTSIRLKDNAKERLLSTGKINGAGELLGLDRLKGKKGHFKINEEEVETLKEVLDIYLLASSQRDALRKIKDRGIKYKRGLEFNYGKLEQLLKNVEWRYDGKWYFNDKESSEQQIVELDHGPVISTKLRDAVLKKRKESKNRKVRRSSSNHVYLLSGILVDKKGNKYSGESPRGRSKQYRYYRGKKGAPTINAELLESTVENRVIEYFTKNHLFENLVLKTLLKNEAKIPQMDADLRLLGRELAENKGKRSKLVSRLADFSPAMPAAALKAISEEIEDLDKERKAIEDKRDSIRHYKENYKSLVDTSDSKKAIQEYAEKFKGLNRVNKALHT